MLWQVIGLSVWISKVNTLRERALLQIEGFWFFIEETCTTHYKARKRIFSHSPGASSVFLVVRLPDSILAFWKAIFGKILSLSQAGQDVSLTVKTTSYFMNVSWGQLSSIYMSDFLLPWGSQKDGQFSKQHHLNTLVLIHSEIMNSFQQSN